MQINIYVDSIFKKTVKLSKPTKAFELLQQFSDVFNIMTILAYEEDNKLKNLSCLLNSNTNINFVTAKNNQGLKVLNYTCGLLLAYTVKTLFPKGIIALVENTEDGFHLDFDYSEKLKKEDLWEIKKQMKKALMTPYPIVLINNNEKNFKKLFSENIYIEEYLKNYNLDYEKYLYLVANKELVAKSGIAFLDTSIIKYFELLSLTGAYWLGNDNNTQLQRISGLSHFTQQQLTAKIKEIEDRKLRDHRIIGKKLEIFTFNEEIGKGLPIFLPNGMTIKKELQKFLRQKEFKWEYEEVSTPILGSIELYKRSGHWEHYRHNMFSPIVHEHEQLVLRPMTCPHHCMLYKITPHSYRDLPIRFSEHSLLYRYETSGALTGLERVRSMELTDAHIFVRADQIKEEFKRCFYLIEEVLSTLKIKIDYLSLSLRDVNDKQKYFDDNAMWDLAENELKKVVTELKLPFKTMIGEAAFYGPKLDVQIKTPIGHEVTISTIQFDFLLAKKFDLFYIDEENKQVPPIIIHRGLIGTYERFIATLLEQTLGILPLWLSPVQVIILPINNTPEVINYCEQFLINLRNLYIRAKLEANESLNKRIKIAHENKIPYVVIIGTKEIALQKVTYHTYKEQKKDFTVFQQDFIDIILDSISAKK